MNSRGSALSFSKSGIVPPNRGYVSVAGRNLRRTPSIATLCGSYKTEVAALSKLNLARKILAPVSLAICMTRRLQTCESPQGPRPTDENERKQVKGYPDGQAEATTRHHSRVDDACARETTIRPAGNGLCKSRGPTAQPATQPPNAARRDHGMATATHGTTLI
jgi:hypothetical protein